MQLQSLRCDCVSLLRPEMFGQKTYHYIDFCADCVSQLPGPESRRWALGR